MPDTYLLDTLNHIRDGVDRLQETTSAQGRTLARVEERMDGLTNASESLTQDVKQNTEDIQLLKENKAARDARATLINGLLTLTAGGGALGANWPVIAALLGLE